MKCFCLISYTVFIVFLSSCEKNKEFQTSDTDIRHDELVSEKDSGLSKSVYEAIVNDPRPSIVEKNKIVAEIGALLKKDIKDNMGRNKAIDSIVLSHGNHVGLNTMLKFAIEKDYPISSSLGLIERPSGLSAEIYDAITTSNESANASIKQKNAIIMAVHSAMLIRPKDQSTRDAAIGEAVKNNGDYAGLAAVIKAAADKSDPIPVPLLSKPPTMDYMVYLEIKDAPLANADKNVLIQGVDNAVRARPQNKKDREQTIRSLILSVGNPVNLADKIIRNINYSAPIVPLLWRSAMPQSVFDAITLSKEAMPATNAEKNEIKKAVDAALNRRPQDQTIRDTDIQKAVLANGNYPNFANHIINEVNIAEPIDALKGLPAGMDQKVYDAITKSLESLRAKNKEKNAIIEAVDAAMKAVPKVQKTRDAAINNTVASNGNYPNLNIVIKLAVDAADPIGGAGPTLIEQPSGMPFPVYNLITFGPHTVFMKIEDKNDIILGVDFALRHRRQDQVLRNVMISSSIKGHLPKLESAIINVVNIAEPIVDIIKSPLGMDPKVYYTIKWSPESVPAKNAEINAIILAVDAAMKATPKNQAQRDLAIDNAVATNGNYPNLAPTIKIAVDDADPI